MHPKIIFDLSEVLIYGLVGVEKSLVKALHIPEIEILRCFGGDPLQEICRGQITEEMYLQQILALHRWDLPVETLKQQIRGNFHSEVEGTRSILVHLAKKHDVFLLSDHAREWIEYIQSIHPFLGEFKQAFFSYELGKTKKDPETFTEVLRRLACQPKDCWLIDDSAENIAVAASIGINGIRFENADQLRKQLVKQLLW